MIAGATSTTDQPWYFAVDPGKKTGWAGWSPHSDEFHAGEGWWYEFLADFEEMMSYLTLLAVVSESYVITMETIKKTRQNWSLEAIGVMRYLLRHRLDMELHLQSASEGKKFATADKLKKAGWWPVGQPHAQDAARHLLTFVAKNRESGFNLSRIV